MHAQTTFSNTHLMPYGRAAVSAPRRRAELFFWLFVYALLVALIAITLGAAALLLWQYSSMPAVAVSDTTVSVVANPASDVPLSKPVSGQPVEISAGQNGAQDPVSLGEAAVVLPTQVQATPVEPTPLATMTATAEPTQSEPTAEATPVVEATATQEVVEEPTHRQIYLGLEDDYHSQLSVPDGGSACGPAALLIALDYYDLQSSLPDIIAQASFAPQEGGYDPTCTANAVCFSPKAMAKLASDQYGLDVQYGEGWTFDQVYAALESGSPVIADIAWDPNRTTLGHFVVIYGIDPDSNMVYYHDPYDGAALSASWDDFSYRWSFTVDVGDPLQSGGYSRWGMAIYMR